MARKLKGRKVGKKRCAMVKMANGARHKLCVTAKRYGYAGELHPRAGSSAPTLPVPTGKARTLKSAMSAAKKFVRGVNRKSRRSR